MEDIRCEPVREFALLETDRAGRILLWTLFGIVGMLAVFALTVPLWGWP